MNNPNNTIEGDSQTNNLLQVPEKQPFTNTEEEEIKIQKFIDSYIEELSQNPSTTHSADDFARDLTELNKINEFGAEAAKEYNVNNNLVSGEALPTEEQIIQKIAAEYKIEGDPSTNQYIKKPDFSRALVAKIRGFVKNSPDMIQQIMTMSKGVPTRTLALLFSCVIANTCTSGKKDTSNNSTDGILPTSSISAPADNTKNRE